MNKSEPAPASSNQYWKPQDFVEEVDEDFEYTIGHAKTALSVIQARLAPRINNMLSQMDLRKAEAKDAGKWVSLTSQIDVGSMYVLDRVASSRYFPFVVELLLQCLPIPTSRQVTASKESHSFASFMMNMTSANQLDDVYSEFLECVVESVYSELLACLLQHCTPELMKSLNKAAQKKMETIVNENLLQRAFESFGKLSPRTPDKKDKNAVPLSSALFGQLRRHTNAHWALIFGRLSPMFTVQISNAFQSKFSQKTMDHYMVESLRGLHFVRFDLTDEDAKSCLEHHMEDHFRLLKDKKISKEFRQVHCTELVYVLQNVNFAESKAAHMIDHSPTRKLFIIMEEIYKHIDEKLNPRKSQDKDLGDLYNILLTTVLARSMRLFYGSNVELFLNKRIFKLISDKNRQENMLTCLLLLLRGPHLCKDSRASVRSYFPQFRRAVPQPKASGGGFGPATPTADPKPESQFACVMMEMENEPGLFRGDLMKWIVEALFPPKKPPIKDMVTATEACANLILQIGANSWTGNNGSPVVKDLLISLLNVREHKITEYFLIGIRALRYMLDPLSGFVASAGSTRCNDPAIIEDDFDALRSFAQMGIQEEVFKNCLAEAGAFKLGFNDATVQFTSILQVTAGSGDFRASIDKSFDRKSAYNSEHLAKSKDQVKMAAQLIQETSRVMPYLKWRSGLGNIVESAVILHSCPELAVAMSASLQRIIIFIPEFRPHVLLMLSNMIGNNVLQHYSITESIMNQMCGLLKMWTQILRNGADGKDRAAAAIAEQVLETQDEYPQWVAKTEAASLVLLSHAKEELRGLGLTALQIISDLCDARDELAAAVRTSKSKRGSIVGGMKRKQNVYEILMEGEGIVVQRALFRFQMGVAMGVRKNVRISDSRSAPSLQKCSIMTGMWQFVLPEILFLVVQKADSTVVEFCRQTLFSLLPKDPGAESLPAAKATELMETRHLALFGLHGVPVPEDLWAKGIVISSLSAEVEQNLAAGKNILASMQDELAAFCTSKGVWDILTCNGNILISAVSGAHACALGSILSSLVTWAEDSRKNTKPTALLRKLFRTISERSDFVQILIEDPRVTQAFIRFISSRELFLQAGGEPRPSVLDGILLISNLSRSTGKVVAHAVKKATAEGGGGIESVEVVSFSSQIRGVLYSWLRATHKWPPPTDRDAPKPTPGQIVVLDAAREAAQYLLELGPTYTDNLLKRIVGELRNLQTTVELKWLIYAEIDGYKLLRSLIATNPDCMVQVALKLVYNASSVSAIPAFHALCDQVLPDPNLDQPPISGIPADICAYFESASHWSLERDIANVKNKDLKSKDSGKGLCALSSALQLIVSSAASNDICGFLLMGLRALIDTKREVRCRAFGLVRQIVLLMTLGTKVDPEDMNAPDVETIAFDFSDFMSEKELLFDAASTASVKEAAIQVVDNVSIIVNKIGKTQDFINTACRNHNQRAEWGGMAWTVEILAPALRFVDLCDEDSQPAPPPMMGTASLKRSAPGGAKASSFPTANERGNAILTNLMNITQRFAVEAVKYSVPLWDTICRTEHNTPAHSNLHAIISFMLATNHQTQRDAVLEVALAIYRKSPAIVAMRLVQQLSFSIQGREVTQDDEKGTVSEQLESRLHHAEAAILFLSELGHALVSPVLDYLHTIVVYALLHFPASINLASNGQGTDARRYEQTSLPHLLFAILSQLQPQILFEKRANVPLPMIAQISSLLGLLKTKPGVFKLDFDVCALPTNTGMGGASVDTMSVENAADGLKEGSLSSLADSVSKGSCGVALPVFVGHLVQCCRDAKKSIQTDLGSEVLQWALHCEDFSTSLKAHQIYRALLQPADMTVVDGLVRALFVCLSHLSGAGPAASTGGRGGKGPRQSIATSATHFQTLIAASEIVATLQALTIAFRHKGETGHVQAVGYAAAVLMRASGTSAKDMRVLYHLGLRLLAELLNNDVGQILTMTFASPLGSKWSPPFRGILPLLQRAMLDPAPSVSAMGRDVLCRITAPKVTLAIDGTPQRYMCNLLYALPFLLNQNGNPPSAVAANFARNLAAAISKVDASSARSRHACCYGCSEQVCYGGLRGFLAKARPADCSGLFHQSRYPSCCSS